MTAPVALSGTGNAVFTGVPNSATFTVAKPANVADGDLLVAVVATHKSAATWSTVPSGWTSIGPSQTTVGTSGCWYKAIPSAAAETATSYSWVASGTDRGAIGVFRVTGARNSNPADASGAYVTTGTTSIVAPAVTAVDPTALLIAVYVTNNATTTPSAVTPPGTLSEIGNASANPASSSYLEVSAQQLSAAGATGSRAATVSPTATSAAGALFTITPPASFSAALSATGALTAAGSLGASGSAALVASGSLAAAGHLGVAGSAALSATSSLTLDTTTGLAVLLGDGTWGPSVAHHLESGSWMP